ncbi:MAG: hypothetical protein ACI8SK_001654, partial [Shewanella sp.]
MSEAKLQVNEREAQTLNWLLDMDIIQAAVGSAVTSLSRKVTAAFTPDCLSL